MYEKFVNFSERLMRNKLTYVVIILIAFTVVFLMSYFEFDSTPATSEDYVPLIQVQNDIRQDFNNVYHYDNVDIDISNDYVVVSVYSEECSIDILFDENLNYIYTVKKDNMDFSKTVAILIFLIASIALAILFIGAFFIILILLDFIIFTVDNNKKITTNTGGDIDH